MNELKENIKTLKVEDETEKFTQEKLKQEKIKKISGFFQWIFLIILSLIFIGVNIERCGAFIEILIDNDMSVVVAEQNRMRRIEELESMRGAVISVAPGYYPLEYNPDIELLGIAMESVKALCVFPIVSILCMMTLVIFRNKSNWFKCFFIGICLLLEIVAYLWIVMRIF